MRPSTLDEYHEQLLTKLKEQAHNFKHSAFNTYLFQLSGCKFFLRKFTQLQLIYQGSSAVLSNPLVLCSLTSPMLTKGTGRRNSIEKLFHALQNTRTV